MKQTIFDLLFGDMFYENSLMLNEGNKMPYHKCCCKDNDVFQWNEHKTHWEMIINAPKAEIVLDNEFMEVTVNYEFETDGFKEAYHSHRKVSFPQNSIPETMKAEKVNNHIVLKVDKAVINEEPKDDRRRIVIE